jgi:hypothetical protein
MVLESICPPALLYLAFSVIQIVIDLYRGDSMQALFKFIVMIIFTIVLNAMCNAGMSIISWFIVFIPFILMTYITTILFFIFGFNPSKIMNTETKCKDTQFGCCNDGVTAKRDPTGRGCPFTPVEWNNKDYYYRYDYERERERRRRERDRRYNPYPNIGGCGGTRYGCCDDLYTSRSDWDGTNCPGYKPKPTPTPPTPPTPVGACATTEYGCCPGGVVAKNKQGTNCPAMGSGAGSDTSTSNAATDSSLTSDPMPASSSSSLTK